MLNTPYITKNWLLTAKNADTLYHDHCAGLPLVDFHTHLSPKDIAEDRTYADLAELWLEGDHYKWRAMRANGVEERFCTGDASNREKFQKWAETMPYLLRNQLYPWTHLELARFFDIDDVLLGPDAADRVWNACNEKLQGGNFSARSILRSMNVERVGTTDDPADSLEFHAAIEKDDTISAKVTPTFRPDRGVTIEDQRAFNEWVDRLAECVNEDIENFEQFLHALWIRHEAFHEAGCRMSDHGVETIYAEPYGMSEIDEIFAQARLGVHMTPGEAAKFKSAMLFELAAMNHERGWIQQIHVGPYRNVNTRMHGALGPDSGYDTMGETPFIRPLLRFLNRLDRENRLAKTIVYNIHPKDNEPVATALGNFQEAPTPGKLQLGPAWWFLDQKEGMEDHLRAISKTGLLSRFVGMVTDSRSFLSFSRHEYFRRILCNFVAQDIESGLIPDDLDLAGRLVADVSYHNAKRYLG